MGCSESKPQPKQQQQQRVKTEIRYVAMPSEKGARYAPAPSCPPPSAPQMEVVSRPGGCREMDELAPIDARFFRKMKYHENRDFVVIVDKSGSMNAPDRCSKTNTRRKRWDNARNAIDAIVLKACEHDDDGITLYLFSNGFDKFENVDSPARVLEIFNSNKPRGSTDMSGVLEAAFDEHFEKLHHEDKPTTILVITDGQPDSEQGAIDVIEKASNRCHSQEELSVTFIQIGDDDGAHRFLKRLDDELNCRFDIVDTLKDDCLQNGLSFEEMIYLSVTD